MYNFPLKFSICFLNAHLIFVHRSERPKNIFEERSDIMWQ